MNLAVYDDDLLELLDSLELKKQSFLHGKLVCAFCGDVITWEKFALHLPRQRGYKDQLHEAQLCKSAYRKSLP